MVLTGLLEKLNEIDSGAESRDLESLDETDREGELLC